MYKNLLLVVSVMVLFSGCASVPMESKDKLDMAIQFNKPAGSNAGLYIYRSGSLGGALKKGIWVDGKCIGETAPNVYFYEVVQGEVEHKISSESESSPNDLSVKTVSGKNYFIRQYITMGVFSGGVGLELVDEAKGKEEVSTLKLAKSGGCSK